MLYEVWGLGGEERAKGVVLFICAEAYSALEGDLFGGNDGHGVKFGVVSIFLFVFQ